MTESSAVGRRRVGAWFAASWAGQGSWLVAICALSAVNAIAVAAFPWLWKVLVDEVRGPTASAADVRELGLTLLGVGVLQSAIYVVLQSLRSRMNARIARTTRSRMFEHLTALPEGFFSTWRPGDLVTRLTDDSGEKTAWFLCSGVFRALEAALIVVACLAAMVWIDPVLTMWVVLPLPVLVAAQTVLQRVIAIRAAEVQSSISAINDELATTFGAIRIVQASALGSAARDRFAAETARQADAEVRSAKVNQAVFLMYGHGWQVAVAVLLVVGSMRHLSGAISLGELVAFEGFVMSLVWPMFDVGMFVSKYGLADVALGRLDEILDVPRAAVPTRPLDVSLATAGLRLEDVQVRAIGAAEGSPTAGGVLTGVDLELRAGELVAVVGEVGAGKSILTRLLAGALQPVAGAVRIGGVAVEDLRGWRDEIAYVPQDPVLLSLPIRDNILLGRDVAPAVLERALRVSRFLQDVPAFPHGLDTLVGERGVTLSGGQQQRVALARALVGTPRLLILDDATAALDADTEAAFWNELEQVLPDCSAVVVTHRVSTLERADRIVVLDRGRVAQVGRHRELLGRDGPYRRIYGRLEALAHLGTGLLGSGGE